MTSGSTHDPGGDPPQWSQPLEVELADEELVAKLRAAASRDDPVPAIVHEAGLAAFELRALDAELAELVADSALDAGALVRGGGPSRLVSFASPRLAIEVEVTVRNGARRLVGQVIGAEPRPMELDHRDGVLAVAPDSLGRFVVDGVAPGPVRLRGALSGGGMLTTSWVIV